MRHVDLCDETGRLAKDAVERMHALYFFPDDDIARSHCYQYFRMKSEYYFETDHPGNSDFFRRVDETLLPTYGPAVACGLVTLMMYKLMFQNEISRTKYQAVKLAATQVKRLKKDGTHPLEVDWGDDGVRKLRIRESANNLETAFTKNSSLGPLWAARILINDPTRRNQEETRSQIIQSVNDTLRLALGIERVVVPGFPDSFQNVWLVEPKLPIDVSRAGLPPVGKLIDERFPS